MERHIGESSRDNSCFHAKCHNCQDVEFKTMHIFPLCILQEAALSLGYLTEQEFDEWVDPKKMLGPS